MLVRNGKLLEHNLRRDRMTRREIESEMRQAGIASMDDVAWALIEPNGKISFIRQDDSQQHNPATAADRHGAT